MDMIVLDLDVRRGTLASASFSFVLRENTVYLNLSFRLGAYEMHPEEFCMQYQVCTRGAQRRGREAAESSNQLGLLTLLITLCPRVRKNARCSTQLHSSNLCPWLFEGVTRPLTSAAVFGVRGCVSDLLPDMMKPATRNLQHETE